MPTLPVSEDFFIPRPDNPPFGEPFGNDASETEDKLPEATQVSFANKQVLISGTVGLLIFLGTYLLYRASAVIGGWWSVNPLLAVPPAAGLILAVGTLLFFTLRSLRRYFRLRQMDYFRDVSRDVRQGNSQEQEIQILRKLTREFAAEQFHVGSECIKQQVQRLLLQLDTHADTERSIAELEEYILRPLDKSADDIILQHATWTATGTAVASSTFDAVIVAWQAVALIDNLSRLYGGRPGLLGTLRLLRRSMAMIFVAEITEQATELLSDSMVSKATAKLGGRLAQGLANGLMMLRLGDAVKRQCRPLDLPRGHLPLTELIAASLGKSQPMQV